MGLLFKFAGATFDNDKVFGSITLPERDGLLAEFILGGTEAESLRNRADPTSPATLIGSPTYSNAYATVLNSGAGSYGFDTGVLPTTERTVIAISSRNIGAACHTGILGGGEVGLWNDWNTGAFSFSNGLVNGATDQAVIAATPPANDSTTMFFQAGSGIQNGVGKLYVGKSGVLVTDSGTQLQNSTIANTYKIGGFDAVNFGGGAGTAKRVAYAAIFNRVLTDDEVQAAYEQLVAYYASRDVAVN